MGRRILIGDDEGDSDRELRMEGSLVETPLPQLLHNHYVLRTTGLLHLERGAVKKIVYLRDGYPIFVRSNLVRECLGQLLIREGVLTAGQREESLRRGKESGRLQGTVLIEMGVLTPHELHAALARQVTEKLLETFAWLDGTCRFLQAREFKKDLTAIELSPASLILEGLRRHYPPPRIGEILLPHRSRFPVQTQNPLYRFQELTLSPRDARVLGECRGQLTLDQIVARHPLTRRETEQLLAALLVVGMVESRPSATVDDTGDSWLETAEGRQVRQSFLADYGALMPKDHLALLDVSAQSTPEEVRKAFFGLVKRFHPDRFRQEYLSADLRQKINELFQKINEAHETLADPVRRRHYLDELKGEKVPSLDVTSVLQAETSFQKGMVLLRVKNYRAAWAALELAVQLSPDEPEYLTHYAWALYKAHAEETGRRHEAQLLLLKSAGLNPRIWSTHLYLGHLLKAEGRLPEAEKSFERTIQCNPDCTEALRELRLSNLRRDQSPKGLLARLFRK